MFIVKKHNFFDAALKPVTGSVLAQSLSVICAPILANLYYPDDFGMLNIFP